MKIAPLLAVFCLVSLLGACDSLDNPFHTIMHTGDDARVYNTSTGNWEWPNTTPRPKPKPTPVPTATPALVKSTPVAMPTPAKKAAFVQGMTPPPAAAKAEATPVAKAEATPVVVEKKATPTPVAARAVGVLNMETGKIEWTAAGAPTPKAPVPTPTPKKTKATPTPKATVSS